MAKYKTTYHNQTGFTLIELLVAVSILAIVAVLGSHGLDSIVRARATLNRDLEQTRGMQLSFAQLQSDCEHAAVNTDLNGRAVLAIEPTRLTIVRSVMADNQPTGLQVISYRINNGVLQRSESPATRDLRQLDKYYRTILGDTDKTIQAVNLQTGITGMAIQTWFSDGQQRVINGEISISPTAQPGAAPGPPQSVPTGLQVALQIQGREGSMVKNFLLGAI
ncbi:MAG: prepilin-type N-terminal cleavage/methylation domain-containing protein [Burkholderiales bacterium]|nr:prepilin-type N-terminal cleavage/methylation domain-containing protein [Burkholderiales bacterium]